MLLLMLSLVNAIFIDYEIIKLIIALFIFIYAEVARKNGTASKAMIVGQFISAFILLAFIGSLILGIVYKIIY